MRIDRVTYAKLFNLGNYENERIELSMPVEEFEPYSDTLAYLKREVEEHGRHFAQERGADRDAAYQLPGATRRLAQLNAAINVAQLRWDKALTLLEKHGVNVQDIAEADDIPF